LCSTSWISDRNRTGRDRCYRPRPGQRVARHRIVDSVGLGWASGRVAPRTHLPSSFEEVGTHAQQPGQQVDADGAVVGAAGGADGLRGDEVLLADERLVHDVLRDHPLVGRAPPLDVVVRRLSVAGVRAGLGAIDALPIPYLPSGVAANAAKVLNRTGFCGTLRSRRLLHLDVLGSP
jgi:hypothetical protein